jgi:hypothetical protein
MFAELMLLIENRLLTITVAALTEGRISRRSNENRTARNQSRRGRKKRPGRTISPFFPRFPPRIKDDLKGFLTRAVHSSPDDFRSTLNVEDKL